MGMRKQGMAAVILAVVAVFSISSPAWAAFTWHAWAGSDQSVAGYDVNSPTDTKRIVNAFQATDISEGDSYSYFKMTLQSKPVLADHADYYGVFISPLGTTPVADISGGSDGTTVGTYFFKKWNGTTWVLGFRTEGVVWEFGEEGIYTDIHYKRVNNVLEWAIPTANIGSDFSWLAATIDLPYPGTLRSQTAVASTPIPSAAWLLGSGLLGLIGLQRRRARKA